MKQGCSQCDKIVEHSTWNAALHIWPIQTTHLFGELRGGFTAFKLSIYFFINRPAKDISQVEAGITNEPISASNMKGKTIFDTPNGLAWRRLHHGTAKLKGVHGSAHLLAFFAMV